MKTQIYIKNPNNCAAAFCTQTSICIVLVMGIEKDIRKKGDKELLLLITVNLPFDYVTYVHYCQKEEKKCVNHNK